MDFISFPPWVMVRWHRLWMRRWIRRWIQPRRMQFHLRHTVRFPCIFFEAVFITWFSAMGRRIQRWRHRTITQGGKRLISLWDRCLERERERDALRWFKTNKYFTKMHFLARFESAERKKLWCPAPPYSPYSPNRWGYCANFWAGSTNGRHHHGDYAGDLEFVSFCKCQYLFDAAK